MDIMAKKQAGEKHLPVVKDGRPSISDY